MSRRRYATSTLVSVALAGCAAQTPGTHPHEMSVAHHETSAAQEERTAGEHERRYDPEAAKRRERCRAGAVAASNADPCWTSVTNPTAEHLAHAEQHRARAAEHRAASQALRDAETRACRGLSSTDRDESPFDRREDIERIELLYEPLTPKLPARKLVGAVVAFRAVPGLTAPWLQRLVDCHVARNSALGHDVPEMSYCPLVPKGVSARVVEQGGALAVEVRSDQEATAKEIARRAELLRTRSGK